jgi:uncharacterized membrane protein
MEHVERLMLVLTLIAALGCGLIAGVFFAFSAFVMRALARLPPGQGIAAMQSINITVLNTWFLGVFLGTAAICAVAIVGSFWSWPDPRAIPMLIGGILYFVGTFLMTVAFNVPRNEMLARLTQGDPESAKRWSDYVIGWTAWNHVRTAASLSAAISFSIALAR